MGCWPHNLIIGKSNWLFLRWENGFEQKWSLSKDFLAAWSPALTGQTSYRAGVCLGRQGWEVLGEKLEFGSGASLLSLKPWGKEPDFTFFLVSSCTPNQAFSPFSRVTVLRHSSIAILEHCDQGNL